jgi:EAL domain-containing protein (putative c-di-GMP-specific phosphodiesterase class I)/GGDEF domain-containing protein
MECRQHGPVNESIPLPLEQALDRLIAGGCTELSFHFQPIVDSAAARIVGFEALTRGPADSPLHSPLVLFEVAARGGRLVELERVLVRRVIARHLELGLVGKLFVNVSTDTVLSAADRHADLAQEFADSGLPASQIVIEITETRPATDPARLYEAVRVLRSFGLVIAIDDLGAGFSSLRRWVDLRPDYVKIDRHFVDGVAFDPVKQQFVRSIMEMARTSGSIVVAEGIEIEEDLRVLHGIGVTVCQGYLLARPNPHPRNSLHPDAERRLAGLAHPGAAAPQRADFSAARLALPGPTVTAAATCMEVLEKFRLDERLRSMPVLDDGLRPIGVLRSMHVAKRATQRYFIEVFGNASCLELMDPHALVFDEATSLHGMSQAVTGVDDHLLIDGFIVTSNGRYAGSGRVTDLLKAVSDQEVAAARHANPLTDLPGNVPIDRHLESLLRQRSAFIVAYWDLSDFKAYNDVYGYRRGDDMIRLTARLIVDAVVEGGDFAGHIGGDDFVTVMQAGDWESRIAAACLRFDREVVHLLSDEHLAAGGYETMGRQGQRLFHALPRLAVGVLRVAPGQFDDVHQLSAALAEPKRQAKRDRACSGYLVVRGGGGPPAPDVQPGPARPAAAPAAQPVVG